MSQSTTVRLVPKPKPGDRLTYDTLAEFQVEDLVLTDGTVIAALPELVGYLRAVSHLRADFERVYVPNVLAFRVVHESFIGTPLTRYVVQYPSTDDGQATDADPVVCDLATFFDYNGWPHLKCSVYGGGTLKIWPPSVQEHADSAESGDYPWSEVCLFDGDVDHHIDDVPDDDPDPECQGCH